MAARLINFSESVDCHLKSLMVSIPLFAKDTNNFIHKLQSPTMTHSHRAQLCVNRRGGIILSHTSWWGLRSNNTLIKGRQNQEIPTNLIIGLAELVLKNNNFEFNSNHYLQTLGTATGTEMAPAYANLFLDRLERTLISEAQIKP